MPASLRAPAARLAQPLKIAVFSEDCYFRQGLNNLSASGRTGACQCPASGYMTPSRIVKLGLTAADGPGAGARLPLAGPAAIDGAANLLRIEDSETRSGAGSLAQPAARAQRARRAPPAAPCRASWLMELPALRVHLCTIPVQLLQRVNRHIIMTG